MSKIRKQIYIESHQEELLKATAQSTGVSEAEIIRQAINQHIGLVNVTRKDLTAWEAEKAFIKTLKQRPPLPGGRDWTRDELYEQ
jgi:hypothetical protein